MSSTRGRTIRQGTMVTDPAGASGRTSTDTGSTLLRPAYSFKQGVSMPGARDGVGGAHAGLLFDLSSVATWRTLIFAGALVYLVGFHASLGRLRVGAGPA